MNLYENIKKNLNESEKLTFDDCGAYIPEEFKPVRCWYGEKDVEVYRYRYKKDKDIFLQYYGTDEFSIGSEDNFNKCAKISYNSKSSKIKDAYDDLYNVWEKYEFKLRNYSYYDDDQIIAMCDNLSARIHEFLDKYGKNLKESKDEEELKEAANPANEEKNKIIRDALKGPKSYNKNLKALQKMGINKNSKEMSEDDYGQTIYLHGPNGRHVSVDPDGTNVWRTFSTRDEDHYKKELDFKNRNSSNYNNQEHLDFNGKRAKAFDYYNYLHKPENEYQNEVDKANEVKDYRDNEDKTGYNLPDEALTPEEKSLNRRPRKYVQLSKDRKELEDELAGYDETKKQLDKVNRKIKKLHNK